MKDAKEALISHLTNQGFSQKIIGAFQAVRREDFILPSYKNFAYNDCALPLTEGSTISQPSTIATMLELLDLKNIECFLEIGSGCGYVLALINAIIPECKIYGVEINELVYKISINNLYNFSNIEVLCQNGKSGLHEKGPFDRILISAACQFPPIHLMDQLTDNGIIVASVENSILKLIKNDKLCRMEEYPGFRFVPLI